MSVNSPLPPRRDPLPPFISLVSLTLSRAALHFSLPAGEHMLLVPLDSGVFRREGLFNVY